MILTINIARNIENINEAFAIRQKIFVEKQKVPQDAEFDGNDFAFSTHILIQDNGTGIGTCRLRNIQNTVKMERLCLLPNYRNKGIIPKLLDYVKQIMAAENQENLCFLCEEELVPYWQKHGFFNVANYKPYQVAHMKLYLMGLNIHTQSPINLNIPFNSFLETKGLAFQITSQRINNAYVNTYLTEK